MPTDFGVVDNDVVVFQLPNCVAGAFVAMSKRVKILSVRLESRPAPGSLRRMNNEVDCPATLQLPLPKPPQTRWLASTLDFLREATAVRAPAVAAGFVHLAEQGAEMSRLLKRIGSWPRRGLSPNAPPLSGTSP